MRTPPGTILVATDFSPRSTLAVERAARLAREHKARLELLHVAASLGSTAWWSEPSVPEDGSDPTVQRLQKHLDAECAEVARRFGITAASCLRRGSVAAVLERRVQETGAGLVVVGATGAGAVARRLLGSTPQSLMRTLSVPLLVVRRRLKDDYRQILLASDFSDEAQAAIEFGLALAPTAAVSFFSALDVPRVSVGPYIGLDETTRAQKLHEARTSTRARLGELAGHLGHGGANVIVRDGRAADELPGVVHDCEIELLCLGAHARGALERAVTGSTSTHAAAEADCDVLIVPPKSSPAR